ncbi:hypothetical protein HN873_032020, partial [Arachis hypogaea]
MSATAPEACQWHWENAAAGGTAGFATVAVMHPLDVVRTRFQVNDGRVSHVPNYKNTVRAIFTIARSEGLRGLYAGFLPGVIGSTISWGLYFFFYDKAKQRYARNREDTLSPGLHLASAAEAGGLVCLCTNPVWLVKQDCSFRLLFIKHDHTMGFLKAQLFLVLQQVSHGTVQFTAYEELRKVIVDIKHRGSKRHRQNPDDLL